MKTAKSLIFIISGIVIAFAPQVITWLFYVIGGILIVGSVLGFLGSAASGQGDGTMLAGAFTGALIGAGVMAIPRFTSALVPIIAGLTLGAIGIGLGVKALNKQKKKGVRITGAVLSLMFISAAVVMLFNIAEAAEKMRMAVGIVMILSGVISIVLKITEKNEPAVQDSNVIDVDSFTIHDDD